MSNWPYYDKIEIKDTNINFDNMSTSGFTYNPDDQIAGSWDSMSGEPLGCGQDDVIKIAPTTNRFDLEQEILNCWRIVDDLKILNEAVLEQDADRDKISNILTGLADLYEMKFNKTFEIFEECIRQRKI
jgi:hypothetical protein